jgi:hypothetical protein
MSLVAGKHRGLGGPGSDREISDTKAQYRKARRFG